MLARLAGYRIEATVFVCGALLMALEIIGARLLIPYYGDTVYVWGSVIGIILLSLSLGYYFGGKLADRRPEYGLLSLILVMTGLFIAAIPFTYSPAIAASNALPRMVAPLVSVTLLFLVPSLLLGMVSPFAIKLKAKTIKRIGKLSGNLYALSTIGSVAGTFLATFVLVLLLPTKATIFCLAATSFLVAALLVGKKPALALCGVAFLIFAIVANSLPTPLPIAFPANLTGPVVIESLYGQLRVYDTERNTRVLSINNGTMSEMDLSNQSRILLGWYYSRCMEMPFVMNPHVASVLNIGLGAGIYQRAMYEKHTVDMETVEINDKILEVAKTYFNLTLSDSFRVYIDDARAYLQKTGKKYDLIAIDVFLYDPEEGYKIPFHLATEEFYSLLKDRLNQNGLIVMNFVVTKRNSKFLSSEYKTIASVFDSVYVFDCATQVIIASNSRTYSMGELRNSTPPELTWILGRYYPLSPSEDSIILTDDYAPINPFRELG